MPAVPYGASEIVRRAVHRILLGAVGHHGDPEMRDVGVGKARGDRRGAHPRAGFDPMQLIDHGAHGRLTGRLHLRHGEQRQLAECPRRTLSPSEDLGQNLGSLATARGHVGVRISVVADQHVGRLEQRGRQVGVDVEGRNQRHIGPEHIAQASDEGGIGIGRAVGDYRAVHRNDSALQRGSGRSAPAGLLDQMPVRRARHHARGYRARKQAELRLEIELRRCREHAADFGVGAGERSHGLALDALVRPEGGEVGRNRGKGVGLVPKAGDEDAPGHVMACVRGGFSPRFAARRRGAWRCASAASFESPGAPGALGCMNRMVRPSPSRHSPGTRPPARPSTTARAAGQNCP